MNLAKAKRRLHRNGWITGYRPGEWWIGARRDFAMDGLVIGVFGWTLIIPDEYWHRRKRSPGDCPGLEFGPHQPNADGRCFCGWTEAAR